MKKTESKQTAKMRLDHLMQDPDIKLFVDQEKHDHGYDFDEFVHHWRGQKVFSRQIMFHMKDIVDIRNGIETLEHLIKKLKHNLGKRDHFANLQSLCHWDVYEANMRLKEKHKDKERKLKAYKKAKKIPFNHSK